MADFGGISPTPHTHMADFGRCSLMGGLLARLLIAFPTCMVDFGYHGLFNT